MRNGGILAPRRKGMGMPILSVELHETLIALLCVLILAATDLMVNGVLLSIHTTVRTSLSFARVVNFRICSDVGSSRFSNAIRRCAVRVRLRTRPTVPESAC